MNSNTSSIANRIREVILSGRWVANTNYKEQLETINFQIATESIQGFNSIALLTFHINYYTAGLLRVTEGGELAIKDKYSFDMPAVNNEEDWIDLRSRLFKNAEKFAQNVELFSQEKFEESFVDPKYGTWQKNLDAYIEHCYYHLGQIVLLRKLLSAK